MRRNIADIMIARNIVDRYLRVDLVRDAEILCDLGRVPRFVDQVPCYDDERRMQAIRGSNGELQVCRLLLESHVIRIHTELRIAHLNEEGFLPADNPRQE